MIPLLFRNSRTKNCVLKHLLACFFLAAVSLEAQGPLIPSQLGTAPLTTNTLPTNTLNYGVAETNSFDDNVPSADLTNRATNFTYSIQPHTGLLIDRAHWTANLFYGPSFTYSSNISSYNNTSQAAGGEVRYNFTPRLSLDFREAFSQASNPLQSYQASTVLPNLGILSQPSASVLGANVRSTTNASQVDLVYRLDLHTSVSIGGSFNDLKYRTVTTNSISNNTAFQDTRGWSANASYSHQLTPKYSVGAQYTAQNFVSQSELGQFSSLSHQTLGFLNVSLKPTISLSVFAGPEFTELDYNLANASSALPNSRHSSFAGGSTLSWRGQHNGVTASFVQEVSGAGLNGEGSVSVRTSSLQLQRSLSRLSSLNFTGSYTSNDQLMPVSFLTLTDSASVGLTFSKSLTDRLTLQVSALRQQFMGNALPGFQLRSHDIASVSLFYSRTRPIGR